MKRIVLSIMAAATLAGAGLPAYAQGPRPADWQPLAQRQAVIDSRIELGEASGSLSKLQARDLRDQFKGLLNLEAQYRQTGLTLHQREDLQARYDTLDHRIRVNSDPVSYRAGATSTTTTIIREIPADR
jgi:hypothetical protein